MRSMLSRYKLERELRSVGATKTEASKFVSLAAQVSQIKPNVRTAIFPYPKRAILSTVSAGACVGLLVGALLITFSQTSLPTSLLYPLKRASEAIAVSVDPDYRGTVMMRRAAEVQKLVADHAPSKTVLATLADYQSEATLYKSRATNYPAFEYCKASLQQAEAGASNSEREAIQETLAGLRDV
jgi:hypothetical protein